MKEYGINQRVKQLRKTLHLTHERFARLINVPTASIYGYEANQREVSDRVILDICRKFSVNEIWLRTGKGDMLLKYNDNIISDLTKEFNLDEADKKFIHHYVYLSPEERELLRSHLQLQIE